MKVINMQIHKKFQKFNTCYHSRDRRRERNIVWPSDTAHTSPLTVFPPSIGKEGNPIASSLEGMVTPCHLLLLRLTQPGMMPPWALATPLVLYRVPCSLPLSIPLKNSPEMYLWGLPGTTHACPPWTLPCGSCRRRPPDPRAFPLSKHAAVSCCQGFTSQDSWCFPLTVRRMPNSRLCVTRLRWVGWYHSHKGILQWTPLKTFSC